MWKILILLLLGFVSSAEAGSKYNSTTGTKDFCTTFQDASGSVVNDKCTTIELPDGLLTRGSDSFTLDFGASTGGGTSMTSAQTAISASFGYVQKAIASDPAFFVGTLGNGTAGKILVIKITAVAGAGTFSITPTTKTGFTTITFDAVNDQVMLLYVDNTYGWVIVTSSNITII